MKFTSSKKVNIDFFSPEFSATKIMTWKFNVDVSTNGRYDMILGRDLLTSLGLDLNFYENVIIGGEGTYKGCSVPMVDIRNYNFKSITGKTVKPEESFINSYVKKFLESDSEIISTCRLRIILDAKY